MDRPVSVQDARLPGSLVDRLRRYMNGSYLTKGKLEELHAWFRQTEATPMSLQDFLNPRFADAIDKAFRAVPAWTRHATVYRGRSSVGDVQEADWDAHPDRAARHFVARQLLETLDDKHAAPSERKTLETFLAFAVGEGLFTSWLSAAVGVRLRPASFELASYRHGDEIRPHQDLFPGRCLAVNFYVDAEYELGTGARLGFSNEGNQEFLVDPVFNSVSMIRVDERCKHWVEPYTGHGVGRYTLSIGEHALDGGCA